MSFFIKAKQNKNNKFKNKVHSEKKLKSNGIIKKTLKDEDVTSSEDEGFNTINGDSYSSEDEAETAQEKKLRLAKVYLEEISRAEKRKAESQELDDACNGNLVQKRLKEDYLKQTGKFRASVADKYSGVDEVNIVILKCKEQKSSPTCLCISSDNKFVYSGSKDGIVVKWSIQEKKRCGIIPHVKQSNDSTIKGHSHRILSIAISYDDAFLAVGDESSSIQIWRPDDLKHVKSFTGHKGAVTGLVFRNETHVLFSASKDRSVRVWSLDEMIFMEVLYGHMDGVTSIDALYKERAITAGGRDSSIRIWKIAEESQLIYNGDASSVDCVKLLNDDNFASGGDDGNICIWGTNKKKPLCIAPSAHGHDSINNEPNWICSLAPLVNTDLLASGSSDGHISLWKLGDSFKSVVNLFKIPVKGFVNALCFTNDGKYLVAAVGTEHRFGRWSVIKAAKNSIILLPLIKN